MIEIKSRWDYPNKDGIYWTKQRNKEDFELTKFQNGKFLDCLVLDTLGNNQENNYFEKLEVTHYKFIPKPKKLTK